MSKCMSKYEEHIERILLKNHIRYEKEKRFKDLQGGRLRTDFYLYLPTGQVGLEIDGQQHTNYIKHFHKTRQEFLHQQENDRRKNSYFLAKGIPLYRIPYGDVYDIKYFNDLFKDKYRVKTKWHNDML